MSLHARLEVAVDDAVEFRLVVSNVGDEPVELAFRSGLLADFAVHADDSEVWRYSDGRAFTQALRSETLSADGSTAFEATWDAPEPGEYVAVATLEATGVDLGATATFEV